MTISSIATCAKSDGTSWPRGPLTAGLVQMQANPDGVDANLPVVLSFIAEAGRHACDLVLFPELSLCGYTVDAEKAEAVAIAESKIEEKLGSVVVACRDAGVTAVLSGIITEGSRLFIAAMALDGSGLRTVYRKQNLHAPEVGAFSAGEQPGMIEIGDWRVGLGVCFDGAHPEHAEELSRLGCHVYALSALFGNTGGREESRAWLSERAASNGIFSLLANHVGTAGSWTGCGSVGAWSPTGGLLAEADATTEQILIVTLDPSLTNQDTLPLNPTPEL